jgi:transcription elongation factor GreB
MSRWRPPQAKSSPYITPAGYRALQDELTTLWKTRGDVTEALSAAAAEGDRSENAEYIYRKKQLREIDRRIRYLQKRLPDLTVVDRVPEERDRVYFGARVRLEREDGTEVTYRIVGADETSADKGWISVDSPVARALLKRRLDDEITVQTPEGKSVYIICGIDYPDSA